MTAQVPIPSMCKTEDARHCKWTSSDDTTPAGAEAAAARTYRIRGRKENTILNILLQSYLSRPAVAPSWNVLKVLNLDSQKWYPGGRSGGNCRRRLRLGLLAIAHLALAVGSTHFGHPSPRPYKPVGGS